MNAWLFGVLCAVCLFGEFYLAGCAFEEKMWSPAIILAASMAFSAIIGCMLTLYVIFGG